MQLNQLYGYFGRKQDLIETKLINRKEFELYFQSRLIQSIIKISSDKFLLLLSQNINPDLLDQLNVEFKNTINLKNSFKNVKSNVALASAVTSYARIEMMKYKTIPGYEAYYSDTDSIFLNKPLPKEMIGEELGQMKDELNGNIISKAYFLSIKQYGYQFTDIKTNKLISKSVFAGVERDSLTFEEVINIFNGKTITKNIETKFYKSFTKLNITVLNNRKLNINNNSNKLLLNNKYLPSHTTNLEIFNLINMQFLKLKLSYQNI